MNVRQIVSAYLAHLQAAQVCCAEAFQERQRTLRAFCRKFGRQEVGQCQPFQLSGWIEGRRKWKSTSTRKAKANQVNACFNWWGKQQRPRQDNPFAGVTYPEAEPRPCLGDDALAALMARANKPYERALRFLRLTGIRLSELCRLQWEWIDMGRGLFVIPKAKNGRPKLVVMVPEAAKLLSQVAEATMNGTQPGPEPTSGTVFLNTRGTPWNRRTLGQQLRRMKARYKIDAAGSLHGIRHQFAHTALVNDGDIALVSQALGHRGIAVTVRYYGHLAQDMEAIRRTALKATR